VKNINNEEILEPESDQLPLAKLLNVKLDKLTEEEISTYQHIAKIPPEAKTPMDELLDKMKVLTEKFDELNEMMFNLTTEQEASTNGLHLTNKLMWVLVGGNAITLLVQLYAVWM